ncbi:MAG: hypothetical protein SH807_03090 [Blastochloris sp.]|jgi:DNA-directed RNA polymerase subunit RPC12/RpoP|nr:hypothetical protein [Blastochloris sp.]
MTIDFISVFSLYVFLFLAVIFTAWILSTWKSHRERVNCGKRYVCSCCGKPIRADHALISVRCGHCGVRNKIKQLKILES